MMTLKTLFKTMILSAGAVALSGANYAARNAARPAGEFTMSASFRSDPMSIGNVETGKSRGAAVSTGRTVGTGPAELARQGGSAATAGVGGPERVKPASINPPFQIGRNSGWSCRCSWRRRPRKRKLQKRSCGQDSLMPANSVTLVAACSRYWR